MVVKPKTMVIRWKGARGVLVDRPFLLVLCVPLSLHRVDMLSKSEVMVLY